MLQCYSLSASLTRSRSPPLLTAMGGRHSLVRSLSRALWTALFSRAFSLDDSLVCSLSRSLDQSIWIALSLSLSGPISLGRSLWTNLSGSLSLALWIALSFALSCALTSEVPSDLFPMMTFGKLAHVSSTASSHNVMRSKVARRVRSNTSITPAHGGLPSRALPALPALPAGLCQQGLCHFDGAAHDCAKARLSPSGACGCGGTNGV